MDLINKIKNIILLIPTAFIIFIVIKTIYYQSNNITFVINQQPFLFIYNYTRHISDYNKTEIIDNYLSSIPSKYNNYKNSERQALESLLSLKILSNDTNDTTISEAKSKLLGVFSKLSNMSKNIKTIMLYDTDFSYFGNKMIILNNLIYYCEILGFENIYLHPSKSWFLKNVVQNDKINIVIINKSEINCEDINILCIKLYSDSAMFILYQSVFKPEIRINIIKNEIKRNLPNVRLDPNDLYIHIRSGDIFDKSIQPSYAQPPLCFYQKIMENFKFRKIYIISLNDNNPVINKLLDKYPNINFRQNNLEIDVSILIHSYNLVGSVSSFFTSAIKFNDNLRNVWEYDNYRTSEKWRHLHYEFYKFPINYRIFKMKPSENYKNEMFAMINQPNQLNLMIEEICINNFYVILPCMD